MTFFDHHTKFYLGDLKNLFNFKLFMVIFGISFIVKRTFV